MRNEILELINRDHFRHFAIVTSAGVKYDITDPNALAIARDKYPLLFPQLRPCHSCPVQPDRHR